MHRTRPLRHHQPPDPQPPGRAGGDADVRDALPADPGPDGAVRITDLRAGQRRRAIARTTAWVAAAWVLLIGAYYVEPARPSAAGAAVVKLVVGVAVVAVVVVIELARIVRARLPQLRAVEALGTILPLFIVVFASIYLSLGQSPHPMFNTTLDHSKSLYFVVTVFSSVGFGDIVPTTDGARLVVATQMLLDLAFIGAVVRALVLAAARGLARRS